MRVPLAVFSYDDADNVCQIHIEYSSSNIMVVGGLLFQDFYGFFTNDYPESATGDQTPDQSVKLFINLDATSDTPVYIGNALYKEGDDPFVDKSKLPTWFIVILSLSLVIIVALGVALFYYKRKMNKLQTPDQT